MKQQLVILLIGISSSLQADLAMDTFRQNAGDASTVTEKAGLDSNGREFKYNQASNQSSDGAEAAKRTGTALVGSAIPMIASPLPSVRVAGYTLLGMAGLEFAQAAADRGVQGQNTQAETKLRQDPDPKASQLKSQKGGELPQELQNSLRANGVNPEDFQNQLESGKLTDPESVARAAGDTTEFSSEDFSTGKDLARAEFETMLGGQGMVRSENVGEAKTTDTITVGGGAELQTDEKKNPDNVFSFNVKENLPELSGDLQRSEQSGSSRQSPNKSQKKVHSQEEGFFNQLKVTAGSVAVLNPLLASYLNGPQSSVEASKIPDLWLEGLGIKTSSFRLNIFQMARRQYRGYGKWRKEGRRMASIRALQASP